MYISTLGFHETSEPFCQQHSSFHLSILTPHHSPSHFSLFPLLTNPVSTSATDTTTAEHLQSSHTIAHTAGSSVYVLTMQSSRNTVQGECVGLLLPTTLVGWYVGMTWI